MIRRLCAVAIAAASVAAWGCNGGTYKPTTSPRSAIVSELPSNSLKGISQAPTAYLDLHRSLYEVKSPNWNGTISRLKNSGDLFTLHVIGELKREDLSPQKMEQLNELSAAIQKLHDPHAMDSQEALRLLEVAAYADVTCHYVEYPLRVWTLGHVASFADEGSVRSELDRIKSSYKSTFPEEDLKAAMEGRVAEYARGLLERPPLTK